ncbi:ephexin isoform X2 [Halictus rubicundus]|uniref:ephexin isoform X2 n=1 Tax=Halictus rubicundus TaxID=77578 RepID=UPI004035E511
MSLLPIANRSFLHGDRKTFLPTEKIVYATLDSLALKRARLPLQLLPVDPSDPSNADLDVSGKSSPEGNDDRKAEETNPPSPRSTPSSEPDPSTEKRQRVSVARTDFIVGQIAERKIGCHRRPDNDIDDKSRTNFPETEQTGQCDDAELSGEEDRTRSNSNDYERIELPCPVEETLRGSENRADRTLYTSVIVKSAGACNAEEPTSPAEASRDRESGVEDETDTEKTKKKKKKRFARNVLHLVPDYLAKGSKRAKRKKIAGLSLSLSSLKQPSLDPRVGNNLNSRLRSRSLSREELRFLKISSPTNFVHVASATSPSLVRNENHKDEFGSEPVTVITHEEKCATVPLLVPSSRNHHENHVDRMNSAPDASKRGGDADEGVDLRHEFLLELRARSAEILERSQLVKTGGNRPPEGKTNETVTEARVNHSFLWSTRAKNLLKERDHEREDEAEDRPYDDVGPLDPIDQENEEEEEEEQQEEEEETYDDVVSAWGNLKDQTISADVDDGIYDDVICPRNVTSPEIESEKKNEELTSRGNDDDHYLSIANEYSSVEEEDPDEMLDYEQGVYDDVGLPTEERVNSLYAGSTTGSILGKESEWEDLEEPTTSPLRHANRDNAWRRSAETGQIISNKKKAGHRWSRKIRRSKVSRKSGKTCPVRDTMAYDNASDDSTYESLRSFQPDDFSSDSEPEPETIETRPVERGTEVKVQEEALLTPPTRPNPPPPREASLTQTLGRRIKMLRRTWSITKGSLGRMRRRTSAGDENVAPASSPNPAEDPSKESCNDQQSGLDPARYFGLARHFKKSVTGFSTFYLNGAVSPANGSNGPTIGPEEDRLGQEPVYSNTVGQPDPYSILADQEPLYQFYAAAAARAAFDSNSDYYDEVVGTVPQSATDLVRPGHRTLWHQTPQVTGSGLLQRLSTEEKKIQEVKFEILTSEASYLNSLRVLENEFMNEASFNESLAPDEKEKLFGSIPGVQLASERFLAELEAVWRQDPMLHELPDVLLKYADKCLDSYVAYCSNQVSIDHTLKQLRTRKGQRFVETVSQIEARPACHSLSLHSFLMLPMQRITRLPLLADAVLSKLPIEHPDRPRWETVLSSLSFVVAECNEGARAAAKEVEMESLARRLEYSSKVKPIPLNGKHLVKSGAVVQLLTKADAEYKLTFGKKFNKTPLYLLLLTDYLLVAKYKSSTTQEETYTVIDICKRSLIALESAPEDSPFGGRNAMLLTLLENHSGRQAEYILTCDSDTERQRWLEAVSPSKRGLVGETLYEVWDCPQVVALYSYSPNQPDELSLHPGDVINVLRKMPDGWFHGEKLLDGEQGWFPGNYTKEVASEHVRARNLKQRHRLLALNGSALQRKAKQQSTFY